MSQQQSHSNKAYQINASQAQESDSIDAKDVEARNKSWLMTAVMSYVQEGNAEALIDLFERGFPLHQYIESRELIIDLLKGESIRGDNALENSSSQKQQDLELSAAYYYAKLTGSGNTVAEAAVKAAQLINCETAHFEQEIWPKYKDSAGIKIAHDMAKTPSTDYPFY